ncbi:MAG TPA: type II secretion system protein M [Moraxellaceae bacterium]
MTTLMENLRQSSREALAPLRQRWLLLAPREQRALRLLGIFAALLVLVYGLWLPSRHAADNARGRYESNRDLLLLMQANNGHWQGTPAAAGGSVLALASDTAGSSNLSLSRIEPEGSDQVRVWVEKADFNAVASWLAKLSAQGLSLREAQVERQAEGGGVSARFVLSR